MLGFSADCRNYSSWRDQSQLDALFKETNQHN